MGNEFEKDLQIDKYSLDTELLDHSRRFKKWGDFWADAVEEKDRADQKIEVVKAEVEKEFRQNPDAFGYDKITEALVKSVVVLDQRVKDATEEWIQAKHKVLILLNSKEAIEKNGSKLEDLVRLFLSGYWSDPKVKGEDTSKLTEIKTEAQKQALNKKLLKVKGK